MTKEEIMRTGADSLYDEIVCVMQAEYECAESLQATSAEIQSLINGEQFQQVQERLISRGEIIDLMVSLDQQLVELLAQRNSDACTSGWDDVCVLATKLRELMTSIMGMDRVSQEYLKQNCEDIRVKLKQLDTRRKLLKEYGKDFHDNHHTMCNA